MLGVGGGWLRWGADMSRAPERGPVGIATTMLSFSSPLWAAQNGGSGSTSGIGPSGVSWSRQAC